MDVMWKICIRLCFVLGINFVLENGIKFLNFATACLVNILINIEINEYYTIRNMTIP